MSDQTNELTPEQRLVRDALRGMQLQRADPSLKARLRQDFISGRIADRRRPSFDWGARWRATLRWALVPLAAAAVLILLFLSNQGSSWSLLRAYGEGMVLVDGRSIASDERAKLSQSLGREARLELPDAVGMELVCGDLLVMEISPGSDVSIPRSPGRWSGRTMSGHVHDGEILIKTGPDFRGTRLVVTTDDGRIEVTGTTIAIFRNEELTCVCVLTGEARIGKGTESLETIPSGMRKVMFRDGRASLVTEIAPEHKEGLLRFEERNQSIF